MSPRDIGSAENSTAPKSSAGSIDSAGFLTQQQRIAEALLASGHKFLEELQEITRPAATASAQV